MSIVNLATDINTQPFDAARWEALKNRLFDELARGYTMLQAAIETMTPENRIRKQNGDVNSWKASIEQWAQDGSKFRSPPRNFDEVLCLAERIETALESWFGELDKERAENPFVPGFTFMPTSVSMKQIEGFQKARSLVEMVEIEAPPGSGKTFTTAHYLAQCRKAEGFNCPVWSIALRETNCTLKIILYEIALAMHGGDSRANGEFPSLGYGDSWLSNHIADMAATRKGGLLIIDEAQTMFEHLKGATNRHGINIINELRRFTDAKLFGIALLSNGEILRQARQQKSVQLARRMEAWRITAGKPKAEDVDLIMADWNVTGKAERAWSVKVGTGEGGIGALTSIYRASLHQFGEINITTLNYFRRA